MRNSLPTHEVNSPTCSDPLEICRVERYSGMFISLQITKISDDYFFSYDVTNFDIFRIFGHFLDIKFGPTNSNYYIFVNIHQIVL